MSEAAPLDAGELPRVSARQAADTWLATRVLGHVPRRLELRVGGFGAVVLSREGAASVDALGADAVTFAISRGREVGRLALDAAFASRVVGVALGADGDLAPTLGPLGPATRGVVGGFVALVLHAAGAPLAVSLAPASLGPRPADAVAIAIHVSAAGAAGWAALEAPRAWLEDAVQLPAAADELRALTVSAALELGRTTLPGRALAELEPGDAVVFDGEASLAADQPWRARLIVGGYATGAVVAPNGGVTVTDEFRRTSEGPARADGRGRAGDAAVGEGRETTVLAELPIEVVLELARLELRGDELLGLGPGAVVPVGAVRGPDVVLRVGGEAFAEGELVDVEGELAVRVTRMLRGRG